jgi:hypothetical protein
MNTVRHFSSLVNVIVSPWILTSSDGLTNFITEEIQIIENDLINKIR